MLEADLHSHLMPGVDDGSRGAVETVAMARGLAAMGVRRVHLTPHQFRFGNDFTLLEIQRRTDEVWRLLARAEIPLEVCRGAEYLYGERFLTALDRGEELITFEDRGRTCLLVELPLEQPAVGVRRVGQALLQRGITPVLAHPERIRAVEDDPDRLHAWKEAGWLLQLNLPSLAGGYGRRVRGLARTLLAEGLYDCTGSDIHRPNELEALREARDAFRELTEVRA